MNDHELDILVSQTALVPPVTNIPGAAYANPYAFWMHVNGHYQYVDVITFSIGENLLQIPIRRLIIGAPTKRGWGKKQRPETIMGYKCYANLHTKLIIGFEDRHAQYLRTQYWFEDIGTQYWIGSLNLCDSQSGELMIRIDDPRTQNFLQGYFNTLWDDPKVKIQH